MILSNIEYELFRQSTLIRNAQESIKRAIEDKGQTIDYNLPFYDYANKIRDIVTDAGNSVKLFETKEEMKANIAQEGDLAIVYRSEVRNMSAVSEVQDITFPETVTLPKQVTSRVDCIFITNPLNPNDYADCRAFLNASSFTFDYYSNNSVVRVYYESSDGINYTRTDFSGYGGDLTNPVHLDVSIVPYEDYWVDDLGYFMQITGGYFDGLYKYTSKTDSNQVYSVTSIYADVNSVTYNTSHEQIINLTDIQAYIGDKLKQETPSSLKLDSVLMIYIGDKLYGYSFRSPTETVVVDGSSLRSCDFYLTEDHQCHIGFYAYSNRDDSLSELEMYKWTIDMTTGSAYCEKLSNDLFTQTTWSISTRSHIRYYLTEPIPQENVQMYALKLTNGVFSFDNMTYLPYNSIYGKVDITYATVYEYELADTQYTLDSANKLLPTISGYGNNGNVTGDGSIFDTGLSYKDWYTLLTTQESVADSKHKYDLFGTIKDSTIKQYNLVSPAPQEGEYCYTRSFENALPGNKVVELVGYGNTCDYMSNDGVYSRYAVYSTTSSPSDIILARVKIDDIDNPTLYDKEKFISVSNLESLRAIDYGDGCLIAACTGRSRYSVTVYDYKYQSKEYKIITTFTSSSWSATYDIIGRIDNKLYLYKKANSSYIVDTYDIEKDEYITSYYTVSSSSDYYKKYVGQKGDNIFIAYTDEDASTEYYPPLKVINIVTKDSYVFDEVETYSILDISTVEDEDTAYVLSIRPSQKDNGIYAAKLTASGAEQVFFSNQAKGTGSPNGYRYYIHKHNTDWLCIPWSVNEFSGSIDSVIILNPTNHTIDVRGMRSSSIYDYDCGFNQMAGSTPLSVIEKQIDNMHEMILFTHFNTYRLYLKIYDDYTLKPVIPSNNPVDLGIALTTSSIGTLIPKTVCAQDIRAEFLKNQTGVLTKEQYIKAVNTAKQIYGR